MTARYSIAIGIALALLVLSAIACHQYWWVKVDGPGGIDVEVGGGPACLPDGGLNDGG